jgi:hypothetical protein
LDHAVLALAYAAQRTQLAQLADLAPLDELPKLPGLDCPSVSPQVGPVNARLPAARSIGPKLDPRAPTLPTGLHRGRRGQFAPQHSRTGCTSANGPTAPGSRAIVPHLAA